MPVLGWLFFKQPHHHQRVVASEMYELNCADSRRCGSTRRECVAGRAFGFEPVCVANLGLAWRTLRNGALRGDLAGLGLKSETRMSALRRAVVWPEGADEGNDRCARRGGGPGASARLCWDGGVVSTTHFNPTRPQPYHWAGQRRNRCVSLWN